MVNRDQNLIQFIKNCLDQYAHLGDEYVLELKASELRKLIDYPVEDTDEFRGGVETPWCD